MRGFGGARDARGGGTAGVRKSLLFCKKKQKTLINLRFPHRHRERQLARVFGFFFAKKKMFR
jgi:hypothetical protein